MNEHVGGLAQELRRRGHSVTVLAPSNRARDLAAGRRALLGSFDDPPELIAIGPAVPISRRSRMGVPVGVRASLSLALASGRFDVVHGFEPGLPSLSYLALRDSAALTAATFFSSERLGYPPGRAQRERLLARVDALLATTEEVAEAAAVRFPGRYEVVPQGIDAGAVRAGPEEAARRDGVAPDRAAAPARPRPRARGAAGLGARAPAHADPGLAAGRLAAAARADARAHRAHRRGSRGAAPRRGDLRPRRRRPAAPRRRGPDGRRRDRSPARPGRAARARRRRDGADDRGRSLPLAPARPRASPRRARRRPRHSPTGSRRSTSASPHAAAATRRATRSRNATGSSPTSTCTRAGRTTARSTSTSCSTTPRPRGSARSRSPTTTCSAARWRRSNAPAGASSS